MRREFNAKPDSSVFKKPVKQSWIARFFKNFGKAFSVNDQEIQERDRILQPFPGWYSSQQRINSKIQKMIDDELSLYKIHYGNTYSLAFPSEF